MNPFDVKKRGLTFIEGIKYLGISTAVIAGLGSIAELGTKGLFGCRPVFELDPKPVPAMLHVGSRCGIEDRNIIGITFTARAGLNDNNALVFGVPGIELELFGRR